MPSIFPGCGKAERVDRHALNPILPLPLHRFPSPNLAKFSEVGGKRSLLFIKVKLDFPSFFSILKSANRKLLSLSSQMYVVSPQRKQISFQDSHCILQIFNLLSCILFLLFTNFSVYNPKFDSHSPFNSSIFIYCNNYFMESPAREITTGFLLIKSNGF